METKIIQTANEVVVGANFTKLQARKKVGQCFLIMSSASFSLWGSFHSEAIYSVTNDGLVYLLK